MDTKTVSITSVTIINTLSFRSMYIRRWWKSKHIMILHIVHHYIPYNKINPKNQKQYIFQILSKQARVAVVRRTVSIQNIKTYKTTEARLKTTSRLAVWPFFFKKLSEYRLKPPKYIVRGPLKSQTRHQEMVFLSNQTMFF